MALSNKCFSVVYSQRKTFARLMLINGLLLQKPTLHSSYTLLKASTHLIEDHSKGICVLPNLYLKEELLEFRTSLSSLRKIKLKSPKLF